MREKFKNDREFAPNPHSRQAMDKIVMPRPPRVWQEDATLG